MRGRSINYEIQIQGHLAPHRLRHFGHLDVCQEPAGRTVIKGRFRDQAALYGLLDWLQGLGVVLLLVRRLEAPAEDDGASK